MVDRSAGCALLQRGADVRRKRCFRQCFRIDEHVYGFSADDHAVVSGDAEVGRDRKRGGAQVTRGDGELEDLIEARRRFPLDGLLDQLKIEVPSENSGRRPAARRNSLIETSTYSL